MGTMDEELLVHHSIEKKKEGRGAFAMGVELLLLLLLLVSQRPITPLKNTIAKRRRKRPKQAYRKDVYQSEINCIVLQFDYSKKVFIPLFLLVTFIVLIFHVQTKTMGGGGKKKAAAVCISLVQITHHLEKLSSNPFFALVSLFLSPSVLVSI